MGHRICVLCLRLFERVYAPLTAALPRPVTADAALVPGRRCPGSIDFINASAPTSTSSGARRIEVGRMTHNSKLTTHDFKTFTKFSLGTIAHAEIG
jgi:hypothetical protein